MAKTCIFVAQGFRRENVHLQPWRYIYEIALRFSSTRHVVIVTDAHDAESEEAWMANFTVIQSNLLSVRRQTELSALINRYTPTEIWWSTTSRSIAYFPAWKKIVCPITAMITCPLYPWRLLIRAWVHGIPLDELRALLQQRLIPRYLLVRTLRMRKVSCVVTQSQANLNVLVAAGLPESKIKLIPVGIDHMDCVSAHQEHRESARKQLGFPTNSVTYIYLGAARPIRGIYALLRAFQAAVTHDPNIYLGILARGADKKLCDDLKTLCVKLRIDGRVRVIGGWLKREEVLAYLDICDVVTLPFIVVPSDVPIAILEAMARGKPIISSPVDGIPEHIQGRGIVVDPLDKSAFVKAILESSQSENLRQKMSVASLEYMKTYPDWNRIGVMALSVNSNNTR